MGGGVIEHFKDTDILVNQLYEVTKKSGVVLNTVPYLNIGSLTYRQVWGNIPNLYILRDVFEFIHMKLLKGRHMRFGYELSFTKRKLRKIYGNAGFHEIFTGNYPTYIDLEYIRNNYIKNKLKKIITQTNWLYPLIYVNGRK